MAETPVKISAEEAAAAVAAAPADAALSATMSAAAKPARPPRAARGPAAPAAGPLAAPPDPDMDGDDVAEAEAAAEEEPAGAGFGDIGAGRVMPKPKGFVSAAVRENQKAEPEYEDAPPDPSHNIDVMTEEDEAALEAWIAERFPKGVKPVFFGAAELKLAAPKRPGFHRHWFNDDGKGRIASAMRAGYDHVLDEAKRPIKRVVGVHPQGGGLEAFLMETPKKWHDQAMAANQRILDGVDADILSGDIQRKEGDERYVPNAGKAIKITRG